MTCGSTGAVEPMAGRHILRSWSPASLRHACRRRRPGHHPARSGSMRSNTTATASWCAGMMPASAASPATAMIGPTASRPSSPLPSASRQCRSWGRLKTRVHLAGPMRECENFNRAAFAHWAQVLRAKGHEVFSPSENSVRLFGGRALAEANGGDPMTVSRTAVSTHLLFLPRRRCYARHGVDRPASRHAGLRSLLPRPPQRSMEARPCSSQ
jgi:hypothetical protein